MIDTPFAFLDVYISQYNTCTAALSIDVPPKEVVAVPFSRWLACLDRVAEVRVRAPQLPFSDVRILKYCAFTPVRPGPYEINYKLDADTRASCNRSIKVSIPDCELPSVTKRFRY